MAGTQPTRVVPILNVSSVEESFEWFSRLGWEKGFEWREREAPAQIGFGSVCSGECEIFLCRGNQGSRGRGPSSVTGGVSGDQDGDKGVWMSIWVPDVDAVDEHCRQRGLEITYPPTDEPWGVREMHLRHPDGHIMRISQVLDGD